MLIFKYIWGSKKEWLINNVTGEIGLFKYPKLHTYAEDQLTGEHWAEKIASELAKAIRIPCANVDIGMYHEHIGSMSYLIIEPCKEILVEGVQYITQKYPNYDIDNLYDESTGTRYSIQMILECLSDIPFHKDFLKIPVFDCLIGNSDRHQSNWGIIVNKYGKPLRMAPLYDNGSSLCCREPEENLPTILRDKHRFQAIVESKSKSSIRWHNEKKIRHFEMLPKLKEHYFKETIEVVLNIKDYLSEATIDEIVHSVDNRVISTTRQTLVYNFLVKRREFILDTYKLR